MSGVGAEREGQNSKQAHAVNTEPDTRLESKNFFFIEIYLIYNVTLVSGVYHSDSTSLCIMLCSPQM